MARHAIVHLLALCVLFCTLQFTRECKACEKHKHLAGHADTPDECDKEKGGAENDTEKVAGVAALPSLRGSPTDGSTIIGPAEKSLEGSLADEGKLSNILKSTDIQHQVLDVVQRAVKHLEAQDLLRPLQDVEDHTRDLLEKTGVRLSEVDDKATETKLTALLMGLVRLISAIKAVRGDIINVSMAWVQLKESIHNLAEAERSADMSAQKAAVALTEFLESALWMTTTTESVQTSAKHLKQLLQKESLSKAINAEEKGEKISKRILTLLQKF